MRFLKFLDQVMGKTYLNHNPNGTFCSKDGQPRTSGVTFRRVFAIGRVEKNHPAQNRDTHTLASQLCHSSLQQDGQGRPCARVKVKDV
jgi:hypothetical protein